MPGSSTTIFMRRSEKISGGRNGNREHGEPDDCCQTEDLGILHHLDQNLGTSGIDMAMKDGNRVYSIFSH